MLDRIRIMLDNQAFIKGHPVTVSDADIKKYYDENKTKDYRFLVSPAGLKAQGVNFAKDQDKAKKFLKKYNKAKKPDLNKMAKDEKLAAKDFGVVNSDSYMVDPDIRNAIMADQKTAKLPTAKIVKRSQRHLFQC